MQDKLVEAPYIGKFKLISKASSSDESDQFAFMPSMTFLESGRFNFIEDSYNISPHIELKVRIELQWLGPEINDS
jgi:hypothetical protein